MTTTKMKISVTTDFGNGSSQTSTKEIEVHPNNSHSILLIQDTISQVIKENLVIECQP